MSCKTFNLKSCEIRGATYQGRKIDFVNKVITQDNFIAKVYDTQGYLLTEIISIKSGSVVYFPFTAIQNLSKDKYRIKYWADFYLLGTILLGEEELTIGNTCPNCEVDDSTIPFVLELGTETIDFTLQLVYIAIGNGGGEVDLSKYLKRVDADQLYALKNHTHSYNDLTDLPPNQNIDSVVTIGAVTATTNNVNLALHFSGVNRVYIGGENYYKVTEDNFSFTPVTIGIKVLLIYALPDSQIFYLAEGIESSQAVEPTGLPTNALLVARLIVSSSGTTITIPTEGFQLKANEAWVNLLLNDVGSTIQTVSIHHAALRFNILSGAANIKIGGFRFYATQFLYDGIEITLRNETAGDLEITTIAGIGVISIDADGLPITLKQFESIDLAYHLVDGVFYALKSVGDVFDPTSLQNQIDTEIVNRALEDAKKLDKPLPPNNTSERLIQADGGTSDKGDFQLSEQIEISTSQTAQDAWKGKEIWVTASCTLTIPAPSALSDAWNIDILVFPSATLTLAITSGGTWLHTTPATVSDAFFRIARRGNTTTFKTLGI